ncbi:MAG: alpha/beta fold hydrolase [Pseudomonadota bacterium]
MTNRYFGEVAAPDGVAIFYQVDGEKDRPWIVLSNSLATDMRLWDPMMAPLMEHFRVLRYDTRGHGKSGGAKPPYDLQMMTGDVLALMDNLGIERADFMGISLGGMTGLELAISNPERVNRLICCDARSDAPDGYKAIWDGNIARLEEGGLAAVCEPTLERWFTEEFLKDDANLDQLAVVRSMVLGTTRDGYVGVARCLQGLDILPRLGSVSCPTLYVVGESDPAASVAVMEDMKDKTSHAEIIILNNAAHISNLEQPQAFNAGVMAFLTN